MPETSVDILARERAHLAESRAALERMRLQHAQALRRLVVTTSRPSISSKRFIAA